MNIKTKLKIIFLSIIFFGIFGLAKSSLAAGNTYYVCDTIASCNSNGGSSWSGTPSDNNACNSKSAPCKTIKKGIAKMSGGDTLIIGNGTYQGDDNMISCDDSEQATGICTEDNASNQYMVLSGKSGSAGNYTVIRADTDFGVTIDGQLNYYTGAVANWSYGIIRGINFYRSNDSSLMISACSHVKAIRNSFVDAIYMGLTVGYGSTYCLAEQNIAYGINTYYFVDNNYWGKNNYNVYRQNVVRRDAYSTSDNHYTSFATYDTPTSNTYFFDNISLDSEFLPVNLGAYDRFSWSGTISSVNGNTIDVSGTPFSGVTSENINPDLYFYSGKLAGQEVYATSWTANSITVDSWPSAGAPSAGDSFIFYNGPYSEHDLYTYNDNQATAGLVVNGLLGINDDSDAYGTDEQYGEFVSNAAWYLNPTQAYPRSGTVTYSNDTMLNSILQNAVSSDENSNGEMYFSVDSGSSSRFQNNISTHNFRGFQQQNSGGTVSNNDACYANGSCSAFPGGQYVAYYTPSNDDVVYPFANGIKYPVCVQGGNSSTNGSCADTNSPLYTSGIETASLCKSGGNPWPCCTGAGTGSCSSGPIGPTILYRTGRTAAASECGGSNDGTLSCQVYGDTGWNETQDGQNGRAIVKLWPWPNEDKIKTLMAAYNNYNVNGARGFAAPGNDQWGQSLTLTRYIWEYLGNKIPDNIYGTSSDTTPPAAPSGLSVY